MMYVYGLLLIVGSIFLAEGMTKKPWLTATVNAITFPFQKGWGRIRGKQPTSQPARKSKLRAVFGKVWTEHVTPHLPQTDIHINPFVWNWFWRPALSLFGSGVVTTGLWTIFGIMSLVFGISNPINAGLFGLILLFGLFFFIQPEADKEEVPGTNYGALVTWYGMPTVLIRTTGNYNWVGKRLLFDRSHKVSISVTDANGFIILGQIAFQVWKSNSEDPKDRKRNIITIPAKNRALVSMSFTITFVLKRARRWLDAIDPELTLGDQARQENQELVKDINDTDIPAIQPDMDKFVQGTPIITSFIPDSVGTHKAGSMIRNQTGLAMYTMPQKSSDPLKPYESIDEAIARFRKELTASADKKMLELIRTGAKKKGAPNVNVLRVSDPVTEILGILGAEVVKISFSDITMSEGVSDAAEKASSEADQRIAQIESAKTNRAARAILATTEEERKDQTPEQIQLNTILAASQDNPQGVKVVFVPGNNPLAAAAVAGASQMGANK